MRRKAIFFAVLIAVVVAGVYGGLRSSGISGKPSVGITQIVSHPGLDQVRQGVVEQLAQRGFRDKDTIDILFRNANGDPSLTVPIAQEFARRPVTVMVPVTTPSALAAAQVSSTIPIVFGGVTDPRGVGLVSNLDKPGGHITGTSDRWPFADQFTLFFKLLPDLKSVGMLYRPGDDVSAIGIEAVSELARSRGFRLVTRPVSNAGDVYSSGVALLRDVDAVFTGMDQLLVENLDALLKAAAEARKPVLAGDEGSVQRGALAATAVDMLRLGRLTGDMVADVLQGKSPGEMPVRTLASGEPVVNREAAARFGISVEVLRIEGLKLVP